MKKFRYTILLILSILAVTSCNREEYLDIQPKGIVTPSTLEDFRLILDNTVSGFGGGVITDGLSGKHTITRLLSDNVILNIDIATALNSSQNDIRAYLFEDAIYTPTEDDLDWNRYYDHIYVGNVILDGLQRIEDSSKKRALEAEAKLHRAYAYFNLVNIYAQHYNSATAGADLGVPIRVGTELSGLDFTRRTVQEVYDLIIEDILFGTENLEDTQPLEFQFRPSKAAAFGLLSRVYLYQGNYSEALNAVDESLTLQNTLRNINNDPVSFFTPGLRTFPIQTSDSEIIWFKNRGDFIQSSPSDDLINLYQNGDVRREWYTNIRDFAFLSQDIDGLIYGARFFVTNSSEGVNAPELYLIRAECHTRLGNITEANNDLNSLRINRFIPDIYTPVDITDQATLLQFVKDERRREQATNAERLFDIKRYNLFDNDGISITRNYEEQTVTIAPDSKNWVLPIGEKYIQTNPEIIQNPRE